MWEDIQMECFPFSWRVVWWRLSFFISISMGLNRIERIAGEDTKFQEIDDDEFLAYARSMNWRRMCAWGTNGRTLSSSRIFALKNNHEHLFAKLTVANSSLVSS